MKTPHLTAALLLLAGLPLLAQNIDIAPSWDGSYAVGSFGIPNTQTYGQTVTIPAGVTRLDTFGFRLQVPTTLSFRAEVYAWNGSRATGPALYEGPVTSTTDGNVFQRILVNTGGITVTPGAQYVLFFSSSKDNAGHSGRGIWGMINNNNAYTGGTFVYINNGTEANQWTSTDWVTDWGGDLAFETTFGPAAPQPAQTPLPGTLPLIVTGLGAATFLGRRALSSRFRR